MRSLLARLHRRPDGPWEQYRTVTSARGAWTQYAPAGQILILGPLALITGTSGSVGFAVGFTAWIAAAIYGAGLFNRDSVTLSPRGLRPTLQSRSVLPPGTWNDVEVRQWSTVEFSQPYTVLASVRLADGRFTMLPGLERTRRGRPTQILVSSSTDRRWRPLRDDRGDPIQWSEDNDAEVAELLSDRFAADLPPSPSLAKLPNDLPWTEGPSWIRVAFWWGKVVTLTSRPVFTSPERQR